ncbi:transcriptional activator spt7 [Metarhizium album ARSEF 1941]|uniref:Transcriptional activator spt7 n=1 Tax=Metarhizium album (strain ARSEF 1941) TaxID=1081103 RepID=A0A0B2WPT9_METAS|nr:transcriptional activator spt7 [Metarhizium album ARSEF 1941]KHN95005.1 transcriptional activator spt7 [Metarhizium album ARSEF 1941]
MSISNGQPAWPSPLLHHTNSTRSLNPLDDGTARTQTPVDNNTAELVPEASVDIEEEARRALFADLYRKTEDKIALLFAEDGSYNLDAIAGLKRCAPTPTVTLPPTTDHEPIKEPPYKKAKRAIDEDDYDDDDEDEDQEAAAPAPALKAQGSSASVAANSLLSPSKSGSSPVHSLNSPGRLAEKLKSSYEESQNKAKAGEINDGAIKSLEEARSFTI